MSSILHKFRHYLKRFTALSTVRLSVSVLSLASSRVVADDSVDLTPVIQQLQSLNASVNNFISQSWDPFRLDTMESQNVLAADILTSYIDSLPNLAILNEQTESMLGSVYGDMSGNSIYRTGISGSGSLQYGWDLPTLLSQQLNIINTREIVSQYQFHQLLNALLPRTVDTPDGSYWAKLGLTNSSSTAFSNIYSNIWRSLPSEFRRNNIGSYGFGNPTSASSPWNAETHNPDQYSKGYLEAILYWLMRNTAEQTSQNRWERMGGPFGVLSRTKTTPSSVTNDVFAPMAFSLYNSIEDINSNPSIPLPYPVYGEADADFLGYSLPEFFSLQAQNLNMLDQDVDSLESSISFQDVGFRSFVNNTTDESFFNLDDPSYNPSGLLTNFPALYYEDMFMPYSSLHFRTPPRIENYISFQLAKLINRGTILSYIATNGMFSVSNNLIDEIYSPEQQEEINQTAETAQSELPSRVSSSIASIGDAYDFESRLDEVADVITTLDDNTESASVSISIPDFIHLDFDMPSTDKGAFSSLSNLLIWFYRILFFCLYLRLARDEIRYWVKTVSVVDVELPDGGHVRRTDWDL